MQLLLNRSRGIGRVLRHILSPATIYADAHGTYCWQSSEPKLKLRDDDDNEDDDDDDDDDIMMIIIIFIETC